VGSELLRRCIPELRHRSWCMDQCHFECNYISNRATSLHFSLQFIITLVSQFTYNRGIKAGWRLAVRLCVISRPRSFWIHPHLGARTTPPRRPFGFCFRRRHLLRCLTSKAGQNSKKKKCDGDMPCGPNVVNIRVRDDLTRSLLRLPL
jgi:hypothetical protein